MRTSSRDYLVLAMLAMPQAHLASAERVLGAYIFARHGDRTPKILGNTQLTDLGYNEVFMTGSYYHNRYIDSNSSLQIEGISTDVVNLKQLSAAAPSDAVLQNSATGFLQGVYPPVGATASQQLANGSTVDAPLNGYQLIPLSLTTTGTNSEDNTWLQDTTKCQKAKVSSNSYYSSSLYKDLLASTQDFYTSLTPILKSEFSDDDISFKNAYAIYDFLNVARIHNSSTENMPTDAQFHQLLTLANIEQYNLAYNSSETVRAIAGAQLAGEMLDALTETISTQGKSKLNIQFGSYGTFLSYFGLAQLPKADSDFSGIPDYASSMAWELITDSTSGFPDPADISVRFVFHNGTITGSDEPTEFALYGQSSATIPWSEFEKQTKSIAVMSTAEWCSACGNSDGKCANPSSDSAGAESTEKKSNEVSRPVAGVIGAMVTLAVILGLEAAFFLLGGFTIAKRRKAAGSISSDATETKFVEHS
ncbi:histidine phosphatase superfamily [Aspergillus caelatus]|uniref:Histidine phosphatase superfamily n=1 Tax=Aspergillus caelatus TaxID=61420 RepID=A0A5N7AMM8_9EURO|nr:histidine phosphatase superfamily [Aspergillus caelatus]KAE8370496.1 histidine phosphatase superfamily [Aspergillus caelatus]